MSATMTRDSIVDPLSFTVTDVTGRRVFDVEGIDGHRSAGDVATSIASLMELPSETPYSLRDDETARMLFDDQPLGSQLRNDTSVVVIPKAHLG